ncbi:TPA: hypothetical protein N0F65_010417 [Lagenidium giganteum]|uniref:Uncharacterized protein n=1 Tax=Lagenidium giganteum TaxID=4803 RepID=A0AAV2YTB9_9STRA|nr:TPA: hypothetical protein N0F65_010417 [Lagenidium giganteum]
MRIIISQWGPSVGLGINITYVGHVGFGIFLSRIKGPCNIFSSGFPSNHAGPDVSGTSGQVSEANLAQASFLDCAQCVRCDNGINSPVTTSVKESARKEKKHKYTQYDFNKFLAVINFYRENGDMRATLTKDFGDISTLHHELKRKLVHRWKQQRALIAHKAGNVTTAT